MYHLKKSQALLQLFHADCHLHHVHPPYHHRILQQCWQVNQLPELHINSNVKERNELNIYINLVILLKRQVQILGTPVIAVGYNITKITCSVFLGVFLQFLHFYSAAPQFYFCCYQLILQQSVSFGRPLTIRAL